MNAGGCSDLYRSGPLSVFQVVRAGANRRRSVQIGLVLEGFPMRLTWAQHLQAARTLELHGDSDVAGSLCLLGMALLMLSEDLLELEMQQECIGSER